MVSNKNLILDEGEIKSIQDINMVPDFIMKFHDLCWLAKPVMDSLVFEDREFQATKEQYEAFLLFEKDKYMTRYLHSNNIIKPGEYNDIGEFMGVSPFHPCVMFNISPNWKGEYGKLLITNKNMVKNFKKVIESYLNESFCGKPRFTKWKYCLESGSENNFLHAHVVAEINPDMYKSMKTHINKGNHKQQLCKYWNKLMPKGNQGQLKGEYAIQRVLINNREILEDKLKYLIEENKEEGHKNKKDLNLVFGGF